MTQSNHERPRDARNPVSSEANRKMPAGPRCCWSSATAPRSWTPCIPSSGWAKAIAWSSRRRSGGRYHLVIHELAEGWDITQERAGYHLEVRSCLQGGPVRGLRRAGAAGRPGPEYLRYDADLIRITQRLLRRRQTGGLRLSWDRDPRHRRCAPRPQGHDHSQVPVRCHGLRRGVRGRPGGPLRQPDLRPREEGHVALDAAVRPDDRRPPRPDEDHRTLK